MNFTNLEPVLIVPKEIEHNLRARLTKWKHLKMEPKNCSGNSKGVFGIYVYKANTSFEINEIMQFLLVSNKSRTLQINRCVSVVACSFFKIIFCLIGHMSNM